MVIQNSIFLPLKILPIKHRKGGLREKLPFFDASLQTRTLNVTNPPVFPQHLRLKFTRILDELYNSYLYNV